MQALLAMLLGQAQTKLLSVGRQRVATDYPTGADRSFMTIDGTNPPTVAGLRLFNSTTGTYITMTYAGTAISWI